MVISPGLSRRLIASEQTGPRTVLGFFGTVIGIASALTLGLVGVLASADLTSLIIAVLIAYALVLVAMVGWVIFSMQRDPSRLVVGTMTGREFLEYQQWTAGDNVAGERLQASVVPPPKLPPAAAALNPPEFDDDQSGDAV